MDNFLALAKKGSFGSRDELLSILDVLPVPVCWAVLEDGDIQFMNQAFKRTFGYRESDFSDVPDFIEKTYILSKHRHEARRNWDQSWKAEGQGVREVAHVELEVRCADGAIVTVSHRGIVLHDHGIGVAIFEDITERKMTERALRQIVLQDPLTRLGNRRALNEKWSEDVLAVQDARQTLAAVLMVDLDHFKPVNDTLGHEAGDGVLQMVAERLKQSVRHTDLVVRMGGDEFVILLTDIADHHVAERICRRLERAFQAPFTVQGTKVTLGVSVGASLYPRDGRDLSALLHRADQALYAIKRRGKGGWDWCPSAETPVSSFVI